MRTSRLIHVRFDLIVNGSKPDTNYEIARMNLPQVPNPGETISLNGYPYVIKSRGWAASDPIQNPDNKYRLYAYVDVVKLGEF